MAGPPNEVAPNLREDRNNVEREGGWERLIIIQIHLSFFMPSYARKISQHTEDTFTGFFGKSSTSRGA